MLPFDSHALTTGPKGVESALFASSVTSVARDHIGASSHLQQYNLRGPVISRLQHLKLYVKEV